MFKKRKREIDELAKKDKTKITMEIIEGKPRIELAGSEPGIKICLVALFEMLTKKTPIDVSDLVFCVQLSQMTDKEIEKMVKASEKIIAEETLNGLMGEGAYERILNRARQDTR